MCVDRKTNERDPNTNIIILWRPILEWSFEKRLLLKFLNLREIPSTYT